MGCPCEDANTTAAIQAGQLAQLRGRVNELEVRAALTALLVAALAALTLAYQMGWVD